MNYNLTDRLPITYKNWMGAITQAMQVQDYDAAAALAERALVTLRRLSGEQRSRLHTSASSAYLKLNNDAKNQHHLEEALNADPESTNARTSLVHFLLRTKGANLETLQKVWDLLSEAPFDPKTNMLDRAWNKLLRYTGMYYENRGDEAEAITYYRKAEEHLKNLIAADDRSTHDPEATVTALLLKDFGRAKEIAGSTQMPTRAAPKIEILLRIPETDRSSLFREIRQLSL